MEPITINSTTPDATPTTNQPVAEKSRGVMGTWLFGVMDQFWKTRDILFDWLNDKITPIQERLEEEPNRKPSRGIKFPKLTRKVRTIFYHSFGKTWERLHDGVMAWYYFLEKNPQPVPKRINRLQKPMEQFLDLAKSLSERELNSKILSDDEVHSARSTLMDIIGEIDPARKTKIETGDRELGTGDRELGTGDRGLGIGDRGLGTGVDNTTNENSLSTVNEALNELTSDTNEFSTPVPNPQSPVPNSQPPVPNSQPPDPINNSKFKTNNTLKFPHADMRVRLVRAALHLYYILGGRLDVRLWDEGNDEAERQVNELKDQKSSLKKESQREEETHNPPEKFGPEEQARHLVGIYRDMMEVLPDDMKGEFTDSELEMWGAKLDM